MAEIHSNINKVFRVNINEFQRFIKIDSGF